MKSMDYNQPQMHAIGNITMAVPATRTNNIRIGKIKNQMKKNNCGCCSTKGMISNLYFWVIIWIVGVNGVMIIPPYVIILTSNILKR